MTNEPKGRHTTKEEFQSLPAVERVRRMLGVSVIAGAMADGECGNDEYNAHTPEQEAALSEIGRLAENYILATLRREAEENGKGAAIAAFEAAIQDGPPDAADSP